MHRALLAVAFVAATVPALADDASDAIHADLVAFNDRFNTYAATYDIDGMMSLYDADTLWIEPGKPPAEGRDGVPRQTFTFLSENQGHLSHTVDRLFVSGDGSQAVMIGEADVLVESAGLDITGTYLFVLERDGETWEIVADMFNYHDEE
jgi:ketosteroid isomerase-like protein